MTDNCNCTISGTINPTCSGVSVLPDTFTPPDRPPDPLFDFVNSNDSVIAQMYVNEQLAIAAAPINVHKLLGVTEFIRTQDLLQTGHPIASGEFLDYPAHNAFDTLPTEWRSPERGRQVECHSYIGYDFGLRRLPNDRLIYPDQTGEVRQLIQSIVLRQAGTNNNKVSKARIERSDDGIKWYGVSIIHLPIDNECHRYNLKRTVASRFWRIVPITFLGGELDSWHIGSIEMSEQSDINLSEVQIDYGIMENIDRSYSKCPVSMKALVTNVDARTDLSKFGLHLPELNETTLKVGFLTLASTLGRPFVIGDIIEIPHQAQYDINLKLVRRYVEVVDVNWDGASYTAGWVPTIQLITCQPVLASHETKDIFGNINKPSSSNNYENLEDPKINLEAFDIDSNIRAQADSDVPQAGSDTSNIRVFTPEDKASAAEQRISLTRLEGDHGVPAYVEDAMPPNGEKYTEGESFPTNPKNQDYHRLTYPASTSIPARLHRYSSAKARWIFVEEDKRGKHSVIKQRTTAFLIDDAVVPDRLGKFK